MLHNPLIIDIQKNVLKSPIVIGLPLPYFISLMMITGASFILLGIMALIIDNIFIVLSSFVLLNLVSYLFFKVRYKSKGERANELRAYRKLSKHVIIDDPYILSD